MRTPRSESAMRLWHAEGEWVLEAEELVAVERDLYRPAKRAVRGAEAILGYLKRQGAEAALREATLQLLKARRDEDASYVWQAGEWVSSAVAEQLNPEDSGSEARSLLKDLRAELLLLRASHMALRERVRGAEEQVLRDYGAPPDVGSVEGAADIAEAAPAEPKARPPAPLPEALSAPPLEPAAPEEPLDDPVGFPTKNAALGCVKQLLGVDPGLDYVLREPPRKPEGLHVGLLLNSRGQTAGAVLANGRAIAELGGGLLGLTPAAIDALARAAIPSEDALAAMNEFCNTLAAAVNRASEGAGVRAEPMIPATGEQLRSLANAANSAVLASRGGGELWLVTR